MEPHERPHRAASNRSSARKPTQRPGIGFPPRRSNTLPVHLQSVEPDPIAQPSIQLIEPDTREASRRLIQNEPTLNAERDFKRPLRLAKSHTMPISSKHESGRTRASLSFFNPVRFKRTPRSEAGGRANLQPSADSFESSADENNAKEQARSSRKTLYVEGDRVLERRGASEGSDRSARQSRSAGENSNSRGSSSREKPTSLAPSAASEAGMRERLKRAGFNAGQIEGLLAAESTRERELHRVEKQKHTRTAQLAGASYAKIHRDYLSLDTLRYYEIPWDYDRRDPNYYIVLREIDKYEAEVLFEHTRRLRAGKLLLLPGDNVWRDTPVDDQDYDLPITSLLRDSGDDKRRDWETQEASKRFGNRPEYGMPMRSDECVKIIGHSAFTGGESSKERQIGLSEQNSAPRKLNGVFMRRHLQFRELDFNKFRIGILELFEPQSPERARVFLHLEEVQRRFVNFPAARLGGPPHITPYSLREAKVEDRFGIFSCCIDFFHARQYGKIGDCSPSAERPQTLLQAHYPGADKQQDLRQVICQVDNGRDHCLHISHLWAMMIDEDILVTASILSEEELFSLSHIKLETAPQQAIRSKSTPKQTKSLIQVHNTTVNAMWLLDRAQCQTWFEFALHFEDSPWALDNGTTLTHGGDPVLPWLWPHLLGVTESSILKLEIHRPDKEDATSATTRHKDVRHRLQVGMDSVRPVGTAIATSFAAAAQGTASTTEPPDQDSDEDGLPDPETVLLSEKDKRLYRSCHSMFFEDLLTAITRPLPPSKTSRANDSDSNESDATSRNAVRTWMDEVFSASPKRDGTVVEGDVGHSPEKEVTSSATSVVQDDDKPAISAESPDPHTESVHDTPAEQAAQETPRSDGSGDNQSAAASETRQDGTSAEARSRSRSARSPQKSTERRGSSVIFRAVRLSKRQKFLAEGARALMYVFLDNGKQAALSHCGRKLCGALDSFVARLDGTLSTLGTDQQQVTLRDWIGQSYHDLLGLMNIARVLQGDQFGVCTLKRALGRSMLESFEIALRSATFALIFANVPRSELSNREAVSYWANDAERSLRETFYGTMQALQKPPLKLASAARAKNVLCHIVGGIAGRVMPDGRDVYELYNLHIRKLEHEIRAEKPSRSSIKKLRHLRHELEAMREQVDRQVEDLEKFGRELVSDTMEITEVEDENGVTRPSLAVDDAFEPESGPGYTVASMRTIIGEADRRCDDFKRLKSWTNTLLEEAKGQADDINDWRNNAVIIFTIVTIIFLPLSFVASVFGMNTVDVRDMEQGQWVYWASALPLTATVVGATVYWSELVTWERLLLERDAGGSGRY